MKPTPNPRTTTLGSFTCVGARCRGNRPAPPGRTLSALRAPLASFQSTTITATSISSTQRIARRGAVLLPLSKSRRGLLSRVPPFLCLIHSHNTSRTWQGTNEATAGTEAADLRPTDRQTPSRTGAWSCAGGFSPCQQFSQRMQRLQRRRTGSSVRLMAGLSCLDLKTTPASRPSPPTIREDQARRRPPYIHPFLTHS